MGDVVPPGGVEHWQMPKVMLGPACLCLQQACNSSTGSLTPSLLWCQLKMTNKIEKFQTLMPFLFFFAQACERIFIEMHSTESRHVIELEKILYGGAPVHLLARILYWHLMSSQMELWVFAPNMPRILQRSYTPIDCILLWMHSKLGHSGNEHVKLGRSYQKNCKGLTQKFK